jgi:DNA-binding transcriptional regulator LsrR (DeoR family)
MNLQSKLQELKSMHEQGLVTAEVYTEQQKLLLSQGLNSTEVIGSTAPKESSPAAKMLPSAWTALGLVVVLILGGIWLASKFGSTETKDIVNQIASQTGIGAQVIPWTDRAETVARKLLELNEVMIAKAILGIAHPTGESPVLIKKALRSLMTA